MFKRGPGPLASILLPTRGRPQLVREAVDSVYSKCVDKSAIEFLFKLDDDDAPGIEAVRDIAKTVPSQIIIGPRGNGYYDLHHIVNYLSSLAKGDWLFIFNDDAKMLTDGWDQILLNANMSTMPRWGGNEDVCLFGPHVIEREISWEFPILRRKVFEELGHFSLHMSNDSYIYWIMSGLNAACFMPSIKITHFVNEIEDQTKKEGRAAIDSWMKKFNSPEIRRRQEMDRNVLREYLKKKKETT